MVTSEEKFRLATKAFVDPRTVKRVYEGKPIRPRLRQRIEEAAEKLGVKQPPKTKTKTEGKNK